MKHPLLKVHVEFGQKFSCIWEILDSLNYICAGQGARTVCPDIVHGAFCKGYHVSMDPEGGTVFIYDFHVYPLGIIGGQG